MTTIPIQLQIEDFRFIPIRKGTKVPIIEGWTTNNFKFNAPEMLEHLASGGNYGVVCGFGNLVVLDADTPELKEHIEREFPKTFQIRTGSGGEHFYFKCSGIEKKLPIMKDGKHYGDLQARGSQVVGAGSLHPNGKYYEVERDAPIAEVSMERILDNLAPFRDEPRIIQPFERKPNGGNYDLPITDVIDLSGFRQRGDEYQGAHPGHGSTGGFNFTINPAKNVWHCFRCNSGGSSLQLIGVLEGVVSCNNPTLRGEDFKKVLDIAVKKYGLKLPTPQGGGQDDEGKTPIILPHTGKLISEFARELSVRFKDTTRLFFRPESRDIVEIGTIVPVEGGEERYTGFLTVKPARFITVAEEYFVPGIEFYVQQTQETRFKHKSMTSEMANVVLCSDIFQSALPKISRIFPVPIPIMHNGELTFPNKGYDPRFASWLPHDAPEISDTKLPLENAKSVLQDVFGEFCFQTQQDFHNAIAGLLTPFLRGLFGSGFSTRTPAMFYLANRERAGKDYLAGITGIVYEGYPLQEPPISTNENQRSNNTEELRKRTLSAMIGGKMRMHFSNNKGHINNAFLEMILTAERWSDRILGRNELLTFDNELDFSLSGNTGVTYTSDFANRCVFVNLFLAMENANERVFKRPDLHGWVRNNRGLILSALYTLVHNWFENGMKPGSKPFASYPEWARVCGGIMETAGYSSPCVITDNNNAGGDRESAEMKTLFELCFELHPEEWISKSDIVAVAMNDENDIFGYIDWASMSDKSKFGRKLQRFVGRVFSDISLIVDNPNERASRQRFKFSRTKVEIGYFGHFGHFANPKGENGNDRQSSIGTVTNVADVANPPLEKCDICHKEVANRQKIKDDITEKDLFVCDECSHIDTDGGIA
ncbi:MAG: bifunctional DNA primase/polymerase [Candidatus Aenigmatarchaeota archaeon]